MRIPLTALAWAVLATSVQAENHITPGLTSVEVQHNGQAMQIVRSDDPTATIPEAYQKASRACPPFCIEPMTLASGVETLGELEVLKYLSRVSGGDSSVLVIDSRTPDWIARGTIPGSVNIPWTKINMDSAGTFALETEADTLEHILADEFGAVRTENGWDFSQAKTLVMYCNGIWCHQSPTNIRTLIKLGYPSEKLKWYRGGMQDWVSAGLTTVHR